MLQQHLENKTLSDETWKVGQISITDGPIVNATDSTKAIGGIAIEAFDIFAEPVERSISG